MNLTTPTGFVYVIHAIGTSRIKLGYSAEPEKRLRELQIGSPYKLRLLAQWRAKPRIEADLHREFAEYRVGGEWFEVPAFIGLRIWRAVKKGGADQQVRRHGKNKPAARRAYTVNGELYHAVRGKPPWPKGYEIQPHSGGWAYLWRVPKSKPKERIYAGHLSGRAWEEIKSEPVKFQCEIIRSITSEQRRGSLKAA